jgi:hypothetical protein
MANQAYQCLHALVMVGSVVDGVHTDCVDTKALELLNVTLATSNVGDGILSIGCAACSVSVWVVEG